MSNIPWPMNTLTELKGSRRVVKNRPKELLKRSDIEVVNGKLKIKQGTKLKFPLNKKFHEEIKHQGHRYFYCRDMHGKYHLYSRNMNVDGTYTDMYDKINPCIKDGLPEIPNSSVIDGELIAPGKPDSYVPTAIKNQEPLLYHAFGCPIFKREDTFGAKYADILACLADFDFENFNESSFGEINTNEEAIEYIESLLEEAQERGIEGFVLKFDSWDDWFKIKVLQTADYFITGFNISSSDSRKGKVTSFNIGCYTGLHDEIKDMGKVAGLSHELQDEISKNASKYLRKVIECVYQEIAANGKLKHGNFVKFHADKKHTDCVEDK